MIDDFLKNTQANVESVSRTVNEIRNKQTDEQSRFYGFKEKIKLQLGWLIFFGILNTVGLVASTAYLSYRHGPVQTQTQCPHGTGEQGTKSPDKVP